MTTLVLIRHGETEWKRSGRWQGHADIPLPDLGRGQARRVAERLAREEPPFDRVYASDFQCAFETATIIAARLRLPIHPLFELREMDVGAWSDLTSAEIRSQFPDQWQTYTASAVEYSRHGPRIVRPNDIAHLARGQSSRVGDRDGETQGSSTPL
jgi:broad specificity phosphatase PhoE